MSRRPASPRSGRSAVPAPNAYWDAPAPVSSDGHGSNAPPSYDHHSAGSGAGGYPDEKGSSSREASSRQREEGHESSRSEKQQRAAAASQPVRAAQHSGGSRLKGPRPAPGATASTSQGAYMSPHQIPSPFERAPEPQEPAEFHWTDNSSTIYPGDSVSQLGRRTTERKPHGPRPIAPALPEPQARKEESEAGAYSWVQPELLGAAASSALSGNARTATRPNFAYETLEEVAEEEYASEEEGGDPYSPRRPTPRGHASTPSASLRAPLVSNASYPAGRGDDEQGYHSSSGARGPYSRVGEQYNSYGNAAPAHGSPGAESSTILGSLRPKFASLRGKRTGSSGRGDSSGSSNGKLDGDEEYAMKDRYGARSPGFLGPTDIAPSNFPTATQGATGRAKPTWQRMLWDTTPLSVRLAERERGQGIQRWPIACWVLCVVFVIVLIVEMVRMASFTGSPIQTKPSFNVMIGPSGSVLINSGARFAGCTKFISGVSDISWICLDASNKAEVTADDASCSMSDICGFGGFPTNEPNQNFRFIVPIFLHAGVVHLILNGLALVLSSAIVEKQMGSLRFLLLFFPSGVFGFILGSNFALVGQPSVGASGAIFGTHAAILVDLIAHWSIEDRPKRKLLFLVIELIIGFGLGYVPGIDNFSHLGGFLMGLLLATVFLPIIHQTKRHRIITWALRIPALVLVIVLFVVLTKNFYDNDPSKACSWCRYLSCWPTANNSYCKGTGLATITSVVSSSSFTTFLSVLISTFLIPALA